MKYKKFIKLSLIVFLSFIAKTVSAAKTLELVYPILPGESTSIVVSSGLPKYIDYIFRFSIVSIGIIVFFIIIYNGIKYSTSLGNASKLLDAKQGISAGILGMIILLSSVLIFNTINPELTVLETSDPTVVDPIVTPGIYICNYRVNEIIETIEKYKTGDKETAINAARDLKGIMKNGNKVCLRVTTSGNLDFNFEPVINSGNVINQTFFAIPRKTTKYEEPVGGGNATLETKWVYDYGVIFHEKGEYKGRCKIALGDPNLSNPGSINYSPYGRLSLLNTSEKGFSRVNSVTLFSKIDDSELNYDKNGINLYECMNYNNLDFCPKTTAKEGETLVPVMKGYSLPSNEADFGTLYQKDLIKDGLAENTRSITIKPVGSYFAVMYSEDGFVGETCEVVFKDDINLLDQPIGRCDYDAGRKCDTWINTSDKVEEQKERCKPCLKSMLMIKGKVIY